MPRCAPAQDSGGCSGAKEGGGQSGEWTRATCPVLSHCRSCCFQHRGSAAPQAARRCTSGDRCGTLVMRRHWTSGACSPRRRTPRQSSAPSGTAGTRGWTGLRASTLRRGRWLLWRPRCAARPPCVHAVHAAGASGRSTSADLSLESTLEVTKLMILLLSGGIPGFTSSSVWQVALDEMVFTPAHIAAFFTFLTAVEGGSWEVRRRGQCSASISCCRVQQSAHQSMASALMACRLRQLHIDLICTHASSSSTRPRLQDIKAKLRQDYVSTLLTEMVIWPGFQVRQHVHCSPLLRPATLCACRHGNELRDQAPWTLC